MRAPHFPNDAPLDASITEGYEVIGNDGEGHLASPPVPYDPPASELEDDVQSLADTDTGTDAFTNDVDTSSDEDEVDEVDEDDGEDELGEPGVVMEAEVPGDHDTHHEVDMTMAEKSLEHPTELPIPSSAHISRESSVSAQGHVDLDLERVFSAAEFARLRAAAGPATKVSKSPKAPTDDASCVPSTADSSSGPRTLWTVFEEAAARIRHDAVLQESLKRALIILLSVAVSCGYMHYTQSYSAGRQGGELSTVPVASVSSISTASVTEIVLSTSTVTSTITSTKIYSNALQTTGLSRSVASIPSGSGLAITPNICSASIHGRNEILLRVPQQIKDTWLAKQAIMISVSRGSNDLPSESTKVSSVEQGFLIQVPPEEAYGILDVSVATTRKPKIRETFRVNFGRFMFTEALDAGVQLMKGFAQSVVDTVNGTTTWVEEACVPALDRISKQSSVTDSIVQGFHDVREAALSLSGQVVDQVRQSITPERVFQAETEILRTAQDVRDELALGLLRGQLGSKLWWLKVRGRTAEYERYLAAAEPYYKKKAEQAADASRARAVQAKKEIQARRRKERREARRSFWKAQEGGA